MTKPKQTWLRGASLHAGAIAAQVRRTMETCAGAPAEVDGQCTCHCDSSSFVCRCCSMTIVKGARKLMTPRAPLELAGETANTGRGNVRYHTRRSRIAYHTSRKYRIHDTDYAVRLPVISFRAEEAGPVRPHLPGEWWGGWALHGKRLRPTKEGGRKGRKGKGEGLAPVAPRPEAAPPLSLFPPWLVVSRWMAG